MLDDDGKEVPGTRGYKYFGRARELPGVKEMFSKSSTSQVTLVSLCASQSVLEIGPRIYENALAWR
jgi:pre-mRNA-splicing factor ISY1